MEKNNYFINIWGILFLVFFVFEYLFNIGDNSINISLVFLILLFLYLVMFYLRKLKYIPNDCILSFLILPFISYIIFYGINYLGFNYSCKTNYCLNGFRFHYFIAINAFYSLFLIITNVFMFAMRLVSLKKKKTSAF